MIGCLVFASVPKVAQYPSFLFFSFGIEPSTTKQNDVIARALRERFREAGVLAVSLVSSPGSGKTAFLEKTLTLLQPRYRVAALVGDLATENDAARLARSER